MHYNTSLRAFAEINLDNLAFNARAIKNRAFPARPIFVVKADAYGHGALRCVSRLFAEGFDFFAVAGFEEAMELRESGINASILIFGRLFPDKLKAAIDANFSISIFDRQDIKWIEKSGASKPAKVHLKVETGMGRVGLICEDDPDFFNLLADSESCFWEGIYSHFSTADEKDKSWTNWQFLRFTKIFDSIKNYKKRPAFAHIANSAAILDMPETRLGAVRPGIMLYGIYPSYEMSKSIEIKPVMTFCTFVAHIRNIPAKHPVSYGRRWYTKRPSKIAVLSAGYADGIPRSLTNKGKVMIRGKLYPIVGTVTMDQTMIDLGLDVEQDKVSPRGQSYNLGRF